MSEEDFEFAPGVRDSPLIHRCELLPDDLIHIMRGGVVKFHRREMPDGGETWVRIRTTGESRPSLRYLQSLAERATKLPPIEKTQTQLVRRRRFDLDDAEEIKLWPDETASAESE